MDAITIEEKKKRNKFQESPILARRTFIIGITAFSLLLICSVIFVITQRGLIINIVLLFLFVLLAFSGLIVGIVSFRDGKNVFGIIGFILNFILVAVLPLGLWQSINFAIQLSM